MKTVSKTWFYMTSAAVAISLSPMLLCAQEAATAETEAAAGGGIGLWDILYGGSFVNLVIWLTIFGTSFAMVWLVADGIMTVKPEKIMPATLVEGVRNSLSEGDLDSALVSCETHPSPLSNVLMAAFANISDGYDVIEEAVVKASEMENERLMQRINYLNLCGQLAPMLGLLGTVTGMIGAFKNLGSGNVDPKALASNISVALWTTAVGLIISVPAVVSLTLLRNYATRLFLETEGTVLELIKVLRNAEVQ